MSFDGSTLSVTTSNLANVGLYLIDVTLTDQLGGIQSSFITVAVINRAPYFVFTGGDPCLKDIIVELGSTKVIELPLAVDPEGQSVIITACELG
jgi:hypothetical protein